MKATLNEFKLIPEGEYILKLKAVDEVEASEQYKSTGPRWRWTFEANEDDEDGKPFQFSVFTGTAFGGARATLTRLWKGMIPGITNDTALDVDTDDLIGKKFECQIIHEPKENGQGMKANFLYMKPYRKPRQEDRQPVGAGVTATPKAAADRNPYEDDED